MVGAEVFILKALFVLLFFTIFFAGVGGPVHRILTGKGLDL
jgi:hypothetical protein